MSFPYPVGDTPAERERIRAEIDFEIELAAARHAYEMRLAEIERRGKEVAERQRSLDRAKLYREAAKLFRRPGRRYDGDS